MKNQNAVKEISLVCNEPNKLYAKYKHSAYTQYSPYKGEADCIKQEREDNTTLYRNVKGKAILFVKNIDGEFIPHGWIAKRKNEVHSNTL